MNRIIGVTAFLLILGSAEAARASYPCGIYARIDSVEVGPDKDKPEWIKIRGDFLLVKTSNRVPDHNQAQRGYLYFSIGERGTPNNAQSLSSPFGKIHRVFDDGRVPPDNPFVNTPGAVKSIWSYGHRNPQGLAQSPVNGEIYASEHGPHGGDELNHIQRGHNYGWPVITYGVNDNGTPITDLTAKEGMDQPMRQFPPSPAVSAVEFYTGDKFPKWKNSLFMATLVSQDLRRFEIDEKSKVVREETIFRGFGRVREVVTGRDGYLYVTINSQFGDSPGQVIRLLPVDTQ